MSKNHEEGWMKGDANTPMGRERQAYEDRKRQVEYSFPEMERFAYVGPYSLPGLGLNYTL